MSGVPFVPTPGTVADLLRMRLLALDYPSFSRCICLLLEELGYEKAKPAGRREWKGYNRPGGGGYDLEAVLPGGLSPRRVVAQIKQFDGLRVHQRSVDELRGACLRTGAAEALLVTTSSFSKVVQNSQAAASRAVPGPASVVAAPVRLIGGRELLELLICHRLGIRERGEGSGKRLEIDEGFFRKLAGFAAAAGPRKRVAPGKQAVPVSATPQQNASAPTRWRVTVRISASPDISSSEGGGTRSGPKGDGLAKGGS